MCARLRAATLLLMVGGCDFSQTPATMQRCGEPGRPGFDAVVAGSRNEFFTAVSRQSITIGAGVDVKAVGGEAGRPTGLTMARDNNGISVQCECPGGCRTPGPVGCVIQYDPGGTNATCTGDCQAENSCCAGCGWMTASP